MRVELKQLRLSLPPTFRAVAPLVAGANNKPMIGVMNTGAQVVRVWQVFLKNVQTTVVTGILASFELKRITAITGQTALTAVTMDTADTLAATVVPFTGGTATETGGVAALKRWSTDEWVVGTQGQSSEDHSLQELVPMFSFGYAGKGLVLRNGQGFAVLERAASVQGTWDLEVEFTVETS